MTVIGGRARGGTGDLTMSEYLSVGEAAARVGGGVLPRHISDALYSGRLDGSRCPMIGGRRLIPEDYVEEIGRVLLGGRRRKELATTETA
jgi:hypothetical protein